TDIELSATMVQALNKDRSTATRMFIGKDGMRSEMEQDGNSRIMIFNQAKGVMWMLNPHKKVYMEMKTPAGANRQGSQQQQPLPDEPGHPCQTGKLQCKKLGVSKVLGRQVEAWGITFKRGDQAMTTKTWIDRRLRMSIREELPNGATRELRNIKEGVQPPELFLLPAGYKKIDIPQQQSQQGNQQRRSPPAQQRQRTR
ncbi:MAG: DUF4412 domain-containing protein, partial [Gammaproteobacteria bacterium]|nr:DUF4412 domain-containing protein [Gammaproteobacteria bacterium]